MDTSILSNTTFSAKPLHHAACQQFDSKAPLWRKITFDVTLSGFLVHSWRKFSFDVMLFRTVAAEKPLFGPQSPPDQDKTPRFRGSNTPIPPNARHEVTSNENSCHRSACCENEASSNAIFRHQAFIKKGPGRQAGPPVAPQTEDTHNFGHAGTNTRTRSRRCSPNALRKRTCGSQRDSCSAPRPAAEHGRRWRQP